MYRLAVLFARLSIYTLLLALSLFFVSCNSSEPIKAEWHDAAMDMNGKPDLSELKGLRIQDVQARFVIANDNEQLILAVQTSDEALRRQIEIGGVTLWLTNPKNKKETVGLRYPVIHGPGGPPKNFVLPAGDDSKDQLLNMLDTRPMNVELLNKKSNGRMLSQEEARVLGVTAETSYEATTVAHMVAISFDSLAPWLSACNEVFLELKVPKLERPKRMPGEGERRGPPMGVGDDDFGGMGGKGMRGGGRGGPPMGEREKMSSGKAISIKQTIVLASGK